jgi:hypothetical protein
MTGYSTMSVRSSDSACESTEAEPKQQQNINPLKRRHQDREFMRTDFQMSDEADGLDKRRRQDATCDAMSWLSEQSVHDRFAYNACSDSTNLREGTSVTSKVADDRREHDTSPSAHSHEQHRETRTSRDSMSIDSYPNFESHSRDARDDFEAPSGRASFIFSCNPDDIRGRGRTPEREERWGSSGSMLTGSRASSASSVRSMIDERLEWAHQHRMRSASRDNSIPPSPFRENSPFYAEFGRSSNLAPEPRLAYECECCPKDTKRFATESEPRYASALMHNARITLADNPQIARICSQTYVRPLSKKAEILRQRGRSQVRSDLSHEVANILTM